MLDDATEYFDRMARAVVAFRIDIRRIEGKWKLNQNHPRERREKVAQGWPACRARIRRPSRL